MTAGSSLPVTRTRAAPWGSSWRATRRTAGWTVPSAATARSSANLGFPSGALAAGLQADGRIVVAGAGLFGASSDLLVARYAANGQLRHPLQHGWLGQHQLRGRRLRQGAGNPAGREDRRRRRGRRGPGPGGGGPLPAPVNEKGSHGAHGSGWNGGARQLGRARGPGGGQGAAAADVGGGDYARVGDLCMMGELLCEAADLRPARAPSTWRRGAATRPWRRRAASAR